MIKPYFEITCISREHKTCRELEYRKVLLWANVESIEEAPLDDFKNPANKCILQTTEGECIWVLYSYKVMVKQWVRWMDSDANIQSLFRSN